MQDKYDINKEIIEELSEKLENLIGEDKLEPFEYYKKELPILMNQLKKAYPIREYKHAKNVEEGIKLLMEKAKKSARLGIISIPELEKLVEYKEKIEKELLELDEKETYKYHPVTKSFKDSTDIKLKYKPYQERFSNYKRFDEILCGTIRQLEGMFMRKDLCDQLKLLRKNFYQKRILDEEGIIELREIIEKAKMRKMGFEDIEKSFDLFLKDVLGVK